MEPEALAQGANRLMRGRNSFAMAETVAREHGWAFGWRKAEVPGVGHSTTKMFEVEPGFRGLPRLRSLAFIGTGEQIHPHRPGAPARLTQRRASPGGC